MDPGQVKREWIAPVGVAGLYLLAPKGQDPRSARENAPCVAVWQGGWWANYRFFLHAVAIGPFDTVEEAKAVAELPEFDTIMNIRWAAWKENNMKK